MIDYFFTKHIPESQRFSFLGIGQIAYFVLTIIAVLWFTYSFKDKSDEEKWTCLQKYVWILPAFWLLRMGASFFLGQKLDYSFLQNHTPIGMCDISIFIIPLGIYKRNNTILNYLYAIALPGAIVSYLTPTESYTFYANFSWQVFAYYLFHAMIIIFSLLPVTTKLFRPDYREIPKFFGYFFLYACLVYPIDWLLDANYLYIYRPEPGTPTEIFGQWMGNPGFLLPLVALLITVLILMYFLWYLIDKISQKSSSKITP